MPLKWIFYGGSFDPPHKEHIALALSALKEFSCQKCFISPAFLSPHKASHAASAKDRAQMLRIACEKKEGIELWEGELRRKGPSYSLESLDILSQECGGEGAILIGEDLLPSFSSWYGYKKILENYSLLVAPRFPKIDLHTLDPLLQKSIYFLDFPPSKTSSQVIRKALSQGEDVSAWLEEKVLVYISRHGLYSSL